MKVMDPEMDLLELSRQVIGEPAKRPQKMNFKKLLGQEFDKAGLQTQVISDVTGEVPVMGKEVEILFGFQKRSIQSDPPSSLRGRRPCYDHQSPARG